MKRRDVRIGWLLVAGMMLVSGAAFVETAHPVTTGASQPGRMDCPTGLSGLPSTCSEVHAAALAAGSMSRSNYELAQSAVVLAAHTTAP